MIRTRLLAQNLLLSALAAATAAADAPLTLVGPPPLPPGKDFVVTLTGCPGDIPIYLGSPTLGPTPFPKIGSIDIGPPNFIAVLPPIPASGKIELPCDVPCLVLTQPVTAYFQALAARPTANSFIFTDKSNPIALTLDPALTQDCNNNGIQDSCEINDGAPDCNQNGIPDSCEIADGSATDLNDNGVLDACESLRCPITSISDEYYGSAHAHAFYLASLTSTLNVGPGFFLEPDAAFTENTDGTARLTGRIRNFDDLAICFDVVVDFAGLVEPGDAAYPPAGSPKLELIASAYVGNGGPVDPSTWTYYTHTEGTLTGCEKLKGAKVCLTGKGPAFQIGKGASGKNVDNGASGWLGYTIKQQPDKSWYHLGEESNGGANDININLTDCPVRCPDPALSDKLAKYTGSKHAVYLESIVKPLGVSNSFVFEDGAAFVENADGTAQLSGRIRNLQDDELCFNVTVEFGGRVAPGDGAYPPDGSPKKELLDSAYSDKGGPIDPSTWVYYTTMTGALIGCDKLDGASIAITRNGPAFQIGVGANGKNGNYGGSGWISYTILHQPNDSKKKLGAESGGGSNDFNLDLTDCE